VKCETINLKELGPPAEGIPSSTNKVKTHNIIIFCIR